LAVDDTSELIADVPTGDANLDGAVDDDDATILGAIYAPGVANPAWALADFDYNGFVDDDDATLLGAFYQSSQPPAAPLGTDRRDSAADVLTLLAEAHLTNRAMANRVGFLQSRRTKANMTIIGMDWCDASAAD
jgi:hypothetical protein